MPPKSLPLSSPSIRVCACIWYCVLMLKEMLTESLRVSWQDWPFVTQCTSKCFLLKMMRTMYGSQGHNDVTWGYTQTHMHVRAYPHTNTNTKFKAPRRRQKGQAWVTLYTMTSLFERSSRCVCTYSDVLPLINVLTHKQNYMLYFVMNSFRIIQFDLCFSLWWTITYL